jgi:hypothetical protein
MGKFIIYKIILSEKAECKIVFTLQLQLYETVVHVGKMARRTLWGATIITLEQAGNLLLSVLCHPRI